MSAVRRLLCRLFGHHDYDHYLFSFASWVDCDRCGRRRYL